MKQQIVHESRQDRSFWESMVSLPEGGALPSCIQCGTCSATCPVAPLLEHTPRRIIAMMRAGMKQEVLESMTPWVCSSCYECTVNCPAQIRITDVMYALKRRAMAEDISPADSGPKRFSRTFTDMVCRFGRGYELGLMLKHMLPHQPLELLKQAPLGLEMLLSGRLPVLPHRIRQLDAFKKMVKRAVEIDGSDTRKTAPTPTVERPAQ